MLADSAPLVLAFCNRVFVQANQRSIPAARLQAMLEDELFVLRQGRDDEAYSRSAREYLDAWTDESRLWLRKYYPRSSDEAVYELTPAVEKVIGWLQALGERSFVGTESRLKLVFELLREIVEGNQADPAQRLADLQRQRKELDERIRRLKRGELDTLDPTATRERFDHMARTARELLADFREVEQNFRELDRRTRERIARWEGARGGVLADILEERDAIDQSDQGRSFRAFWDFLMSPDRQEELQSMLERSMQLPAVAELNPDRRLRRVHHDWLEAGEHTQRSVALLSRELRRFLDDRAWLENRRIMEIIGQIEERALALRDVCDQAPGMELELPQAELGLPLERPLFRPPAEIRLDSSLLDAQTDLADIDSSALYELDLVDLELLKRRVKEALRGRDQVELAEILERWPLEHGLAELLVWLQLASSDRYALIDDAQPVRVSWTGHDGIGRRAALPRVLFCSSSGNTAGTAGTSVNTSVGTCSPVDHLADAATPKDVIHE